MLAKLEAETSKEETAQLMFILEPNCSFAPFFFFFLLMGSGLYYKKYQLLELISSGCCGFVCRIKESSVWSLRGQQDMCLGAVWILILLWRPWMMRWPNFPCTSMALGLLNVL